MLLIRDEGFYWGPLCSKQPRTESMSQEEMGHVGVAGAGGYGGQ